MIYCSKCGSSCDESMAYCPRCGSPLELAPAVRKADPVTAVPEYTDPAATQADAPAPVPAEPRKTNASVVWLVLNIVSTVLCCPGFLFSIVGIVFAALGSESFKKGDGAAARRNNLVSMIMFIVGVMVGIAGWVLFFLSVVNLSNLAGRYTVQ